MNGVFSRVIRFCSSDYDGSLESHEGRFGGNSNAQYESYGYIETGHLASGDYSGVVDFTWKKVSME